MYKCICLSLPKELRYIESHFFFHMENSLVMTETVALTFFGVLTPSGIYKFIDLFIGRYMEGGVTL